ncbi:MAG: three-Cys-motif partner protein TcmP [Candidatus Methanoperedens sp.]|nr:three-Cys-motif partner protein TcmP [Candidatus Methanoperedens sp.]
MGQIIDTEGRVCEQTKWHSRQKHAFLEEYLNIWSEQVGKDGKSNPPTLDIFDLFASFGFCYCPEEKKTWKGSALLAAECLKKYQNGKLLFLNTYHPDEKELQAQKKSLENGLSNIHLPGRVKTVIESLPIEKAVEAAISHVNLNYPSLWILDPYQPEHLPWDIVERICKLEGSYQIGNRKITRKPELFICLMTGRLQRLTGIEKEKETVGIAMGLEETIWKAKLENYRDSDDNTRRALISMYAEKIANFYKKPPIILEVPSTDGNIVYTVFLCTDHDAGHYVMKLHKLTKYQEWRKIEWEKSAETISAKKKIQRKAEKSGQKQLFFE